MKRIALLALCLAGCSNSDLPDSFRLDRFRVLAIHADQPEVDPGTTVVLTPFVSDIGGGGRAITFSAAACIDPGVGYGADPTCDGSPTLATLATDVAATGLSAPDYTGAVTSTVSVTVPSADVIFAKASARDRFNGVNYLVTFVFKFPDGSRSRAFRRIAVSTRTTKNQNPAYTATPLLSGSAAFSGRPAAKIDLTADLAAGFAETYDEIRDDGVTVTKTESPTTFWYISDGDLSLKVTDPGASTGYTPPEAAPSDHNLVFVVVTRDGRGGEAAYVQSE
jgi:hypothetical protein